MFIFKQMLRIMIVKFDKTVFVGLGPYILPQNDIGLKGSDVHKSKRLNVCTLSSLFLYVGTTYYMQAMYMY